MKTQEDGTQASPDTQSLGRRQFVKGAAGAATLGALAQWTPAFKIGPADAQASCATPPSFPAGIELYQQAFQNWSEAISVDSVWTAVPQTPNDVVTICNWAVQHGYLVRPRGSMHGWSPLTLAQQAACPGNILLVDTTQYLTAVSISTATSPATVTAQAGVTMDVLLQDLENAGLGVTACPAPGDITLGGALAIDGHGTAIPATGETLKPGMTYGSLSNLILSLTVVAWNASTNSYALTTFSRSNAAIKAFLTHVGRAFVVSATLQVGANYRLRCQSYVTIPATTLFAPQGSGGQTMASFLNSAGRVEAIWFPFTTTPWLKVWSLSPNQPWTSTQVTSPYNYSFSDDIPQDLSDLLSEILAGDAALTPSFGALQLSIVSAGLFFTWTYDLWGWSKNTLLYVKPTTLRVTANGYAVLTSRANIQGVINAFTTKYQALVASYQAQGLYPMNGPVEIRITGLDQPGDVAVSGAGSPQLSALRPRPDHPEWNVAVWFDILSVPGTPGSDSFYRDIEQWIYSTYSGSYASVRPEWSKGWAYTATAGWADPTMLGTTIPNGLTVGQPAGDNFAAAAATLDQYDPHRLFSSPLLNALFP